MSNVDKIMNEIYAEYWPNIYYGWKSKKLFASIPEESYSVLAYPPENNQKFFGFSIGDFIQLHESIISGQIIMIWQSLNRIELSLGGNKFYRGDYVGGTINNLKQAKLLVSSDEIRQFFVNNKIVDHI